MFDEIINKFDEGLRTFAVDNILSKLNKEGIVRSQIDDTQFEQMVQAEIEVLKEDGKNVGIGIVAGVAITVLSGGLL